VPPALLRPRETWSNPADYDTTAKQLARLFRDNFAPYAAEVTEEVRQAGPR
jgi:phosphoenolpyruvate carboxykinase (ATP)